MSSAQARRAVVEEVGGAGACAHPVRLAGESLDTMTGELWDRTVTVACKDRRSAVCPSCADLYRRDAWQLVAAGLRGGKGVPEEVAAHPCLFVTLTAPGFGAVHARPRDPEQSAPCHRRRRAAVCPHGTELACTRRHEVDDPALGQPICAGCFDYTGAVRWNAALPELWRCTTTEIRRQVAREGGISVRRAGEVFRLSYVKVVEIQRRGLAHVHGVVRGDGPDGPGNPPPARLDERALSTAIERAVHRTTVPSGGRRVGWGSELAIRVLGGDQEAMVAVAAYVAKYATKSADHDGVLARPIRSAAALEHLELSAHLAELVRTAWRLGAGADEEAWRLRAHAHSFGYPGHFATKSTRYSTTFGALRLARAAFHERSEEAGPALLGDWHYVGRGYRDPDAERLAEALIEARFGLDGDWTAR